MASLKRNQILEADDIKVELVPVPEWGGDVYVKGLNGTERDKFEASTVTVTRGGRQKQNLENLRARLIVLTVIDPDDNGLPLFTEADVAKLGKKSAVALDRVFTVARKVSGLNQEDIEELVEDFDGDQSESSTTE